MATEHPTIGDLTYELLEKMRAEQQEMRLELGEIKGRMTSVEEAVSGGSFRVASLEVSVTGTGKRLDRTEGRLERIERRLEFRNSSEG